MGSVCNGIFCETYDGSSNTEYKDWLESVQPTVTSHEYVSLVTKKVEAQANGVWTTGTIQCLRQDLFQSMTRTLPVNTILPNKSQSFSTLWADFHHRTNANRSSPAHGGFAGRPTEGLVVLVMVWQSLHPSHLPLLSHGLLSLPVMLLSLHLLIPQESLREFPRSQGTSSIVSQGQDLSLSSVNCSTRSVFLNSVIFT